MKRIYTTLLIPFLALCTPIGLSGSDGHTGEKILPRELVRLVLTFAFQSESHNREKTFSLALQCAIDYPNKLWHDEIIHVLYELYKDTGMTKLLVACSLSREPLIIHWIFKGIICNKEKKIMTWEPRYAGLKEECNKATATTTPLLCALALDTDLLARLLIAHGARTNLFDENTHTTPLMVAAMCNKQAVLPLLITQGSLDAVDSQDYTALHLAVQEGHRDTARMLLDKGASLDTVEKSDGRTPLYTATIMRDPQLVALLLSKGASPSRATTSQITPLIAAVYNFNPATVQSYLLHHPSETEHDAFEKATDIVAQLLASPRIEVNFQGLHGTTALHAAVSSKRLEICKLLISKGAQPDLPNALGITARQLAQAEGFLIN